MAVKLTLSVLCLLRFCVGGHGLRLTCFRGWLGGVG